MTYNIRLGLQQGLEAIAAVVRTAGADVAVLQEVGRAWPNGAPGDTPAALAAATGLEHWHHVVTIPCTGGGYGHAVLSRWPLRGRQETLLPQRVDEPRRVLRVAVEAPAGTVHLVAAHLSHRPVDRLVQGPLLMRVAARARDDAGPGEAVIVAGDLNAPDAPGELPALFAAFTDSDAEARRPTYPSGHPDERRDYLLAAGARWTEALVWAPPGEPSDHLPVVATLTVAA